MSPRYDGRLITYSTMKMKILETFRFSQLPCLMYIYAIVYDYAVCHGKSRQLTSD